MLKRFNVSFYSAVSGSVEHFTVGALDFDCALDLICDIQILKPNVTKAFVFNRRFLVAQVAFC